MDGDAISEARAKAQDAESRARLATDQDSKLRWEREADKWGAKLRMLESAQSDGFRRQA